MTGLCDGRATAGQDWWTSDDAAEREQAKLICDHCPVAADCLRGALARGERWGVWAGMDLGVVDMAEPVAFIRPAVYAPRHGENRFYDRCKAGEDGRACDACRAAHALHVATWRATHTPAPVRPPVDLPLALFDEIAPVTAPDWISL